jgi:RNA polymerase sigma factor (sigma-70 family)
MEETSLSLLARVRQSGDRESWDRLIHLYSPLLRRWLRSYDVQDADADELLQDVLMVVVREMPQFEHNRQPGAFRSWLRKVLVHRLRNYWRDRDRRPLVTGTSSIAERLDDLEDEASQTSRVWDAEHDRHVLARLLELVRPRFQAKTWEAFHRQLFRGERPDLVAADLGLSLSSVYVARSRVLAALRCESAGLVDSFESPS